MERVKRLSQEHIIANPAVHLYEVRRKRCNVVDYRDYHFTNDEGKDKDEKKLTSDEGKGN